MLILVAPVDQATARRATLHSLCHVPAHGVRRARDKSALVYEVRSSQGEELIGCAYGSRRRYRLEPPFVCPSSFCGPPLPRLRVAGPFVAYEPYRLSFAVQAPQPVVLVLDLHDGRLLHSATASPIDGLEEGAHDAGDIVLAPDGSVAWITNWVDPTESQTTGEIRAVGRSGISRLVAEFPGTLDTDLRLRGNTLYWSEGGVDYFGGIERSAPFE